jgi:hypothetical protein
MGQTITEKIFSDHVGRPVYAGEKFKGQVITITLNLIWQLSPIFK